MIFFLSSSVLRQHTTKQSMANKTVHLKREELEYLYLVEGLGIDAIAARLNTSHGSVWRAMDAYGIIRRDLSAAITKHHRADFSGSLYEKAYLIGLRLGDLWVSKNKPGIGSKTIVVSCHSSSHEQIELIRMLFETYGHVHTTIYSDGSVQILCYLNETFAFLLPKEDAVPDWILRSTDHFLPFLAGYIDAEGSFSVPRNGQAQFQLKSCDVRIIHTIREFLTQQLGMNVPPPRRVQKRGDMTGQGYRLKNDVWLLAIASKRPLYEFCQLLEPHIKHPKRKRDLCAVLKNVTERGIE